MKKQRERAKKVGVILSDLAKDGKLEYTAKMLLEENGVPLSQATDYVDGEVPDMDGDYFQSPVVLRQLERGHTDIPSSDEEGDVDDDDGGSKQGKGEGKN